jgi:SynChlorMet cassette protein ScmC
MRKNSEPVKSYYLPLADGSFWRLISAENETSFLVKRLARVCRMSETRHGVKTRTYSCTVSCFKNLDSFRADHPELIECGRRHFFRVFYDEILRNAWMFINMEEMKNGVMETIFTTNIANVMQLQMVSQGCYSPCHCALVEIDGKGAIICASGDTGKSTSARRIMDAGYKSHADDYVLLIECKDHIIAQAMPTWSNLMEGNADYSADCSQAVDLSAIFFLKHGSSDYIESLPISAALKSLNAALQDLFAGRTITDMPRALHRKFRTLIFDFSVRLLERLPAYNLHATLHGEFWCEMKKAMEK